MTDASDARVADPRDALGQSTMTFRQILAIGLCVGLNALDGFDVLSISFAAPGIAREWHIDRGALGLVLSMELIGMALGSVVLGQVADRIGRRPTVMLALVVMAVGMLGSAQVTGIGLLAATRLLTGLGIGGMLATINALVAEYTNDRWRSAAVGMMAAGYPLGAILGGSIANMLMEGGAWRPVFFLGAGMTLAFLPLVALFLPEPVSALIQRGSDDTLARVNRSLRMLGHRSISALPPSRPREQKAALSELFSPALRNVTLLLTFAYFLHIMTFYFILKWVPKIVADMGFSASLAGGVLVWANVGGLLGALLLSIFSVRVALRQLLVIAMIGSTVMVILFGQGQADLAGLSWAAAAAGFFTNAVVVGLYALFAASFPTAVRASGTGLVIGVGRGGAALGPVVGGYLFQAGFPLPVVAAIMACGSLLAAVALLALPKAASKDQ